MSSPERLIISNFATGFETDREPFIINNDAFPVINNAYVWRGRLRKKRGTTFLGRLQRSFITKSLGNSLANPWVVNVLSTLGLAGLITNITQANPGQVTSPLHNLKTGDQIKFFGILGMTALNGQTVTVTRIDANNFTIGINTTVAPYNPYTSGGSWVNIKEPNASIALPNGNIVPTALTITVGADTFTDQGNGTLRRQDGDVSSTINYVTGTVSLNTLVGAGNAAFVSFTYYPSLPVMGLEDFQFSVTSPSNPVNFPTLVALDTIYAYQTKGLPNTFYSVSFYKQTENPITWSGGDWQQFWSVNYQGSMWTTQGKAGLHMLEGTYKAGTGTATITFNFTLDGTIFTTLSLNDVLFFNEWTAGGVTINGVTGKVTDVTNAAVGDYVVTFSTNATVAGTGIAIVLTNQVGVRKGSVQDGIRWYDGDPTTGTAPTNDGWVNFSPPLSNVAQPDYLVGANAILPYKNRLLFFGAQVQNSTDIAPRYLQDTVVFSWVGTPYYTIDLSGNPYLVPANQTANKNAWIENVVGFGGFVSAGTDQQLVSVSNNEDVLLITFESLCTKLVYTNNDILPFYFQNINSELGSESTFSTITLDAGCITIGDYGVAMIDQTSARRIDLVIPDQVFDISNANNGNKRVTGIRDYRNEFIYFTYSSENSPWVFPSKTLLFNYRDNNYGIFFENFTTYGNHRPTGGTTWNQVLDEWQAYTLTWDSGKQSPRFPNIIGGNQQGFVMTKDQGTSEDQAQYIKNITGNRINSPNHCLSEGDYIYITDCIGVTEYNNTIQQIKLVYVGGVADPDNFDIVTNTVAATYLGGGTYAKLTLPFIQTKQFPPAWGNGRKVRLGTSRFLMNRTVNGEITVYIYLSQDPNSSYNTIDTFLTQINTGIVYTAVVLTRPEPVIQSINTPPSPDPQQEKQAQIWHRLSTSLQGDSVQLAFTMSDAQMRDLNIVNSDLWIHAIVLDQYPGPILV